MMIRDQQKPSGYKEGGVITMGNFDGVHVGHKSVFKAVLQEAQAHSLSSMVYTFAPHPAEILSPQKNIKYICSINQIRGLLNDIGLHNITIQPFTPAFARLSPETFIKDHIAAPFQPSLIVAGNNFRFGSDHAGTVQMLKKLGKNLGFRVKIMTPVKRRGQLVSSTWIRECISSGEWSLIPKLLGRFFSIQAPVVKGKGLGRKLGFPTLNLQVSPRQLLPAHGVYIAQIKENRRTLPAVMNIGTAPTVSSDNSLKVEIHLIDVYKNWDKKECEVEILNYIRPEKKMPNTQTLMHQIQKDILYAEQYFSRISSKRQSLRRGQK